jgi:hypothetical protein
MRALLFIAFVCLSATSFGQNTALDFLAPPSYFTSFTITPNTPTSNTISWAGVGTFDVQKSFFSDYSDAVTIYSSTGNNVQDLTCSMGGLTYYRMRQNGGSWVTGNIDRTISDGTTGTAMFIAGNSITHGASASPESKGYANYLNTVKNWDTPMVLGFGGFTITPTSGLPVWDYTTSTEPVKTSAYNFAICAYGINDASMTSTATATQYGQALEAWVDYTHITLGWPLNRILLLGPFYNPANTTRIHDFRDAAKQAATNKNVGFLSASDFEEDNGIIPSDNLHPNTAQHRIITLWLAKQMANTGVTVTAPTVSSIQVIGVNTIQVTFNTPVMLTNVGWTFKKNGSANNPTAVSGSDANVINFTVPTLAAGDVVTYSYSQSTGDAVGVQYLYSNEFADATDQAVTNTLTNTYDTDAQALFDAITGTGETLTTDEKTAYNNFYLGLKSDGLYTKIKAFWCFGTSLNKSKFNFVSPLNTDGAYRVTQTGTVTYASDGASAAGSSGNYLDTHFNPSTTGAWRNSLSLFVSVVSSTSGLLPIMGSNGTAGSGTYAIYPYAFYAIMNGTGTLQNGTNSGARGRYVVSRTGSTGWTAYKNASSILAVTDASVAPSSVNIGLGVAGTSYGNQRFSTVGIFDGLSSGDITLLDARIVTFESTLGR